MEIMAKQIKVSIARLITGYLSNSLTEQENNELDDWVNETDENLQVFEILTDWEKPDSFHQIYFRKLI